MKNTWSAIITFIFLAAFAGSLAVGIIADRQNTAETPELEVGDWWAYQETYSWEGGEQIISERMEVTVDSGDAWRLAVSMDLTGIPNDPRFTVEEITMEMAKATLLVEWKKQHGMAPWLEDPEVMRPYSQRNTYSYEWPDGPLWPLSIGKKVRVIESAYEATEYTDTGETTNRHSSTMVYTYEVEGVESVTVPAGTFRCFKVLRYIEGLDTSIRTEWYSPDVKNWIKTTESFSTEEYEASSTIELESYSLAA